MVIIKLCILILTGTVYILSDYNLLNALYIKYWMGHATTTTLIRYSLFLTWCLRALTHQWIAIFLVHSTKTRVFDIFTRVLMTHTRVLQILACSLACTHMGIANTLWILTACYEFTLQFFACTVLAGVNILWGWLSLSQIMISKQGGKNMTSFHTLYAYLYSYSSYVIDTNYNWTRDANISATEIIEEIQLVSRHKFQVCD